LRLVVSNATSRSSISAVVTLRGFMSSGMAVVYTGRHWRQAVSRDLGFPCT